MQIYIFSFFLFAVRFCVRLCSLRSNEHHLLIKRNLTTAAYRDTVDIQVNPSKLVSSKLLESRVRFFFYLNHHWIYP